MNKKILGKSRYNIVKMIFCIGVFVVGTTITSCSSTGNRQFADTVFYNGNILTLDQNFSKAQAVAIYGQEFLIVGNNEQMDAVVGPHTKKINLEGKTVLPGLIDSHAHIDWVVDEDLTVLFTQASTVVEALALIKDRVRKVGPGEWIIGGAWHPPAQLAEQRYLTRAEIDAVAPDNPVFLPTVGHIAMTNSKALQLAGITRITPNPEGGEIERDSLGEATGLLKETALHLVEHLLPKLPLSTRVRLLKKEMHKFNSVGLTSVVVGAVNSDSLKAFQHISEKGEATVRSSLMLIPTNEFVPTVSLHDWADAVEKTSGFLGSGNEWLSFSGIKLGLDGGMTLRTAFMLEAYPDDSRYYGTSTIESDRLDRLLAICNQNDWRVGLHVVGDAAVEQALDSLERVNKEKSILGKRNTLIHASLMRPEQMHRARKLGLRADVQNIFMWDKAATVERFLGKETASRAVPTRAMIDIMGLENIGAGSDYSVNPVNPFLNMYVMVSRKDINGNIYGAEHAITRKEALHLYTRSAASYTFEEERKGSIEAGKLADLIVISDDILTVPEEAIKDIKVIRTIVGGKTVYKH